jgi:hypothetical protein
MLQGNNHNTPRSVIWNRPDSDTLTLYSAVYFGVFLQDYFIY